MLTVVLTAVVLTAGSTGAVPPADDPVERQVTEAFTSTVTGVHQVACDPVPGEAPPLYVCYGLQPDEETFQDVIRYAVAQVQGDEIIMEFFDPVTVEIYATTLAIPVGESPADPSIAPPVGSAAPSAVEYGHGRYEVGTDIQPGLYEAEITAENPLCMVSVYTSPTEEDVLQGVLVMTPGTHYFEVTADMHSVEFQSYDDACTWTPSAS